MSRAGEETKIFTAKTLASGVVALYTLTNVASMNLFPSLS